MTSAPTEEISGGMQQKIKRLMRQQGLGVFTTCAEDGHPYASLIAFAPNQDDSQLYFITPMATRKYANLIHDPRVALLINNCTNDPSDFHQALAVTVLGNANAIADAKRDNVLAVYLKKHSHLHQFAHSSSCAVMAIHITGFTMVQKFQSISDLQLDHDLNSDA